MDYIVRGTAADGMIRAFASNTHDLVQKAREIHHTTPVATAALGRLLTGAGMMGVMMKGEEDVLSITIKGDGPMQGLTVSADSHGIVKGFVYQPELPLMINDAHKLDVGGAIGNGIMTVVKDLGMKEPYSGQIELQNGEIGLDLAYYFNVSEQVPSSVGLGVLVDKDSSVKQAGGFMIQLMPDASEEVIAKLEENLKDVKSVTQMLDEGMTPEDILMSLLNGMDPKVIDRIPTKFQCGCNRKRVARALISVGEAELQSMIDEDKPAELKCEFCNTTYTFTVDEMKILLGRIRQKGQN